METSSVAVQVRPAPPADPIELGLLLRTARERSELRLEDVRDAISVPVVDLDALERGRLETLHTQQAAVVVLFRYAQHLGLEPDELVPVLRAHWPHRGLSVDAFASPHGITPLAELQVARGLLLPIATPGPLAAKALGLSEATRSLLESGSAKRLFALKVLAPTSVVRRARLADAAAAAVGAIGEAERPDALGSGEVEGAEARTEDPATAATAGGAPRSEEAAAPDEPREAPSAAAAELEEDAFGLPMTPVVAAQATEVADDDPPAPIAEEPSILVSLDQWIEPEPAAVPVAAPEEPLAEAAGGAETSGGEAVASAAPVPEEQVAPAPVEGPLPLRITAESQRRWGQHLARFLSERLDLAHGEQAPPGAAG